MLKEGTKGVLAARGRYELRILGLMTVMVDTARSQTQSPNPDAPDVPRFETTQHRGVWAPGLCRLPATRPMAHRGAVLGLGQWSMWARDRSC